MQGNATAVFPSLHPRPGVYVADGFGVKVYVRRRHLVIEDGIGEERRKATFARATSGLKRLVVLGDEGFVTLEAIRWLADVRVALIQIDRADRVLLTSAAPGTDLPALRRAQALTASNGHGLEVTRWLLGEKLAGQARVAARLPDAGTAITEIDRGRSALEHARTLEAMRLAEARAATSYWDAWGNVPLSFARRDQGRIPEHWRAFGRRASAITGNPRVATNPANALLNYAYALLEAECRIACVAVGLDPGIGILHADQKSRDSMALDLMEATRAEVDAWVADLLSTHAFRAQDFFETRQGACRILAPLTHTIAGASGRWGRSVGVIAERVARMLVEPDRGVRGLPTPLTQDNRSIGRDGIRKGKRRSPTTASTAIPPACRTCGVVLATRNRMYCPDCLPERRQEAAENYLGAAHRRLTELRVQGEDPSGSGAARWKIGRTNARRRTEELAWEAEHPKRPDPEVFRIDILPHLRAVPLERIREATGLSLGYAGEIRRGEKVPHPRWWEAMAGVIPRA